MHIHPSTLGMQVHTLLQNGILPSSSGTMMAAYLGALGWGIWIALTRMYLGVHSPLDLGLGAYYGCGGPGAPLSLGLGVSVIE